MDGRSLDAHHYYSRADDDQDVDQQPERRPTGYLPAPGTDSGTERRGGGNQGEGD